jgi:hypothetical protein
VPALRPLLPHSEAHRLQVEDPVPAVEALTRALPSDWYPTGPDLHIIPAPLPSLDARLAITVRVALCPLPEGLYLG